MKRIIGVALLGVAAGYAIHLLRNVAINTAMVATFLTVDDDELLACGCEDDEECDLCTLPPDDTGYQLGDKDEREFRGIISRLDPEENTDG